MTMHPVVVDGNCSHLLRDNKQLSLRVTRCAVSFLFTIEKARSDRVANAEIQFCYL